MGGANKTRFRCARLPKRSFRGKGPRSPRALSGSRRARGASRPAVSPLCPGPTPPKAGAEATDGEAGPPPLHEAMQGCGKSLGECRKGKSRARIAPRGEGPGPPPQEVWPGLPPLGVFRSTTSLALVPLIVRPAGCIPSAALPPAAFPWPRGLWAGGERAEGETKQGTLARRRQFYRVPTNAFSHTGASPVRGGLRPPGLRRRDLVTSQPTWNDSPTAETRGETSLVEPPVGFPSASSTLARFRNAIAEPGAPRGALAHRRPVFPRGASRRRPPNARPANRHPEGFPRRLIREGPGQGRGPDGEDRAWAAFLGGETLQLRL